MKPKRLPNGFGHISKLSGARRRPYMARTTSREVIGYSETYEGAFALLVDYNRDPYDVVMRKATLKDVWEIFVETEFDRYSKSRQNAFKAAYNHLTPLHEKEYATLKTYHYLKFLEGLEVTDNTKTQIISLLKHLDDTAYQLDVIDKKYAYELKGKTYIKKSERIPFSEEEIEILWSHVGEDFVDYILISIYTGFRANELTGVTTDNIDFDEWTITAGSKTKAGKDRVVPIHPRIRELILRIMEKSDSGKLYDCCYQTFHKRFKQVTKSLLGRAFVPHEARHTMRTRLDNVGANKACIDRIMGHKSGDTGLDVYTHKTINQLKDAIGLLK